MSRSRRAPSSPVQLFPFLAVLVSAIGALVLLLLAINRQATLQAIARAVGILAQQTSSEEEAIASRSGELESQVATLREQLIRLGGEQQGVEEKLFTTDRKARGDNVQAEAFRQELAAVTARRVEVERGLETVARQIAADEAAKAQLAAERTNSHRTLVPIVHPGANGTDRQPIYIECAGESVTIWPEKVVVPAAALNSSPYARAGLARAIRELGQYYINRDMRTESGVRKRLEPYPLLLVRPDGVDAFYAVHDALVRERGFAFGYELIETDWSLRFPDPDPRAREVVLAALKRTSLGLRLADGDVGRPPYGIVSNEPTGSGAQGDEQGGRHGSGRDGPRETSAARGGSAQPQLPGSPMADGSRLYSDEFVFSHLGSGQRAQMSSGTGQTQRLTGRGQSAAAQPRAQGQDTRQPSSADQRVAPDVAQEVAQDPTITSEHEPTRRSATRSSTSRRGGDASEPTDGNSQTERLAGNPQETGRITVPRRIETICRADRLVVNPRQVVITLPKAGSFHEVIENLRDEIDREVAAWGPPGKFFQWAPQLFCRVHADALDSYYRLRFEMAGTSISFKHEIVLEDEIALLECGDSSPLSEFATYRFSLQDLGIEKGVQQP